MKLQVTLFLLFACSVCSTHAQTGYTKYLNARFGCSVEYPAAYRPQRESDNGDGRSFLSPDKKGEVRIWGQFNALDETVEQALSRAEKELEGQITYRSKTDTGYVISGLANGRIFYQRTIFSRVKGETSDVVCSVRLEYPPADKTKFDPIVKQAARSLRRN